MKLYWSAKASRVLGRFGVGAPDRPALGRLPSEKKPTLQETIKKSRDARLRAGREAQTAHGEVKGLKDKSRRTLSN